MFACTLGCAASCTQDPPPKRYHARGVVSEVSGSGADLSITIHHESIPNFTGRDGKPSEMPSMQMTFGAANDVPNTLWKDRNKVEFDFDVRWDKRPALWIVHAQPLPESTELTLSK